MIKEVLANQTSSTPGRIAHVTVMPCFDKKLEASRADFYDDQTQTKDVDMVITPVEIEQMLQELQIQFADLPSAPVDPLLDHVAREMITTPGSGSGGYAQHVFQSAAKQLHNIDVADVTFTQIRNSDMKEAVLQVKDQVVLRVAIANGFRNIQNLVQKLKRNKCTYDYVEVMACPSGCLNGGAQLRSDGDSKDDIARVQSLYSNLPKRPAQEASDAHKIYCQNNQSKMRTAYHAVPKSTNALTVKW